MEHFCPQCERSQPDAQAPACERCGEPRPPFGWPRDPLLGASVDEGRYQVLRRLGSGGFGVVYEVRSALGDFQRAMKVLNREQTSRARVQRRFLREAQLLDRLDHPHIVRCYGVGVLPETGQPYMLLELLRGQNLDTLIWPPGQTRPSPLAPLRALEVSIQIASALVEAHALPLMHRDLKPSNVVVSQGPEGEDQVKVIDFGIARILGTDTINLTTHSLLGTPEYMAPEQLNTELPLDERLDLWQLGAVMHFILTGQPPYATHNASNSDPLVIYQRQRSLAHQHGPRPSLKNAALHQHPRLDAFVGRLLATNPQQRPGSAAEVLQELEALRQTHHLPTAPDLEPEPEEPSPHERRPAWAVALLAVALLGLLAVGAWYYWQQKPSEPCLYTVVGQPRLYPGEPAALRVAAWHPRRKRWLRKATLSVRLVQEDQESEVLYQGTAQEDGFSQVNLIVPSLEPGPARWRLTWSEGEQIWRHEVEIEVARPDPLRTALTWPQLSREAPAVDAQERDTGPIKIDLLPQGGAMTSGLRSTLFVLTTERKTGRPVPARVKIEALDGLLEEVAPEEITTDGGGLAWFTVTPVQEVRWRLSTRSQPPSEEEEAQAALPPALSEVLPAAHQPPEEPPLVLAHDHLSEHVVLTPSQPRQLALLSHDPIWDEGKQLQAGLMSLRREGSVYADLYLGERWQHSTRTTLGPLGGGLSIPQRTTLRPSRGVWLARLQVYSDPTHPENAADSRYIALPAPQASREEILRVILEQALRRELYPMTAQALLYGDWLKQADYDEMQRQIAFWLALLPDAPTAPNLLSEPRLLQQ